jgi:hypothetical protein
MFVLVKLQCDKKYNNFFPHFFFFSSAENEEKRVALKNSLNVLEAQHAQYSQPQINDSGSVSRTSLSSPLKSLGDDELSSDGEGDYEPLASFSSPMRFGVPKGSSSSNHNIHNNNSSSSNQNSSSSSHSSSSHSSSHSMHLSEGKEETPSSVPRIDLSLSLTSHRSTSMSHEDKPRLLTGFSPDLADTPLSGRGPFVPNSARPASARWKGVNNIPTHSHSHSYTPYSHKS